MFNEPETKQSILSKEGFIKILTKIVKSISNILFRL